MGLGITPEFIETLISGTNQERLFALNGVKNLLVGHNQRKENAVRSGILEPLNRILVTVQSSGGEGAWTTNDELLLQATLVIGSLANGGQAFLLALCAADVPRSLVGHLSKDTNSRLAEAALRALLAMANLWSKDDGIKESYDFWSIIFTDRVSEAYKHILANRPHMDCRLSRLIAGLISALSEHDISATRTKQRLAQAGFLETLAAVLALQTGGHKAATADADASTGHQFIPTSFPRHILQAISTLVTGSNYRVHCFIFARSIQSMLENFAGNNRSDAAIAFVPTPSNQGVLESRLPPLYVPVLRSTSYAPGTNGARTSQALLTLRSSAGEYTHAASLTIDIENVNTVCAWLLVMARSVQGLDRLCSLKLLALVAGSLNEMPHLEIDSHKTRERERQLALLAVPLAVQLVHIASESKAVNDEVFPDFYQVREEACNVLAILIRNNKNLQIAAVSAGVVKYIAQILRKSFDRVTLAKPGWSARPRTQDPEAPPTRRVLGADLAPELLHVMACRRGALAAIAAITEKEDVHRKVVIDAGLVGYITDSLKLTSASTPDSALDGLAVNTVAVVLEACSAAKSMSRSVTVLRTALVDEGVGKPLIQLLQSPDLDIQIAATDVIINLMADFSASREGLVEANVVKFLVDHAHKGPPALRISSLWALKHFFSSCPKEYKLLTLDQLGCNWLVDLINGRGATGSSQLSPGAGGIGLVAPNAAGEQVNLLNPSSIEFGDIAPDAMEEDDGDGEIMYDEASSTHYQSSQLRSTLPPIAGRVNAKRYLSFIRDIEQSEEYATRRDEVAAQVQALDIIRNFINGDDIAALCDHLIMQIGSVQLYDLLTNKLLPVAHIPSTHVSTTGSRSQPPTTQASSLSTTSNQNAPRPIYQSTDLVLSTIHIIVHLANASPRHRQIMVAQKPLLQALLPHFEHVDHRVRAFAVWTVVNLTYVEDESDRRDARHRTGELRAIGIEQAVRALQSDIDREVRERVKTAIRHLDKI